MTIEKDIQDLYDAHNAELEASAQRAIAEMRNVLTRFVRDVQGRLSDMTTMTEAVAFREQQVLVNDLVQILEDAGYGEFVTEFRQALTDAGKLSLKYFENLLDEPQTLGGISAKTVNLLFEDYVSQLNIAIDERVVKTLEREITRSFITSDSTDDAVRNIQAVINQNGIVRRDGREFTVINIEVLLEDSSRQFHELVKSERAKELGMEFFSYVGPLDNKTSEQCRHLLAYNSNGVPALFKREQITADLHPALRGDPLLTRGHFNCRHTWMPIDEKRARQLGYRGE